MCPNSLFSIHFASEDDSARIKTLGPLTFKYFHTHAFLQYINSLLTVCLSLAHKLTLLQNINETKNTWLWRVNDNNRNNLNLHMNEQPFEHKDGDIVTGS